MDALYLAFLDENYVEIYFGGMLLDAEVTYFPNKAAYTSRILNKNVSHPHSRTIRRDVDVLFSDY